MDAIFKHFLWKINTHALNTRSSYFLFRSQWRLSLLCSTIATVDPDSAPDPIPSILIEICKHEGCRVDIFSLVTGCMRLALVPNYYVNGIIYFRQIYSFGMCLDVAGILPLVYTSSILTVFLFWRSHTSKPRIKWVLMCCGTPMVSTVIRIFWWLVCLPLISRMSRSVQNVALLPGSKNAYTSTSLMRLDKRTQTGIIANVQSFPVYPIYDFVTSALWE